MKISKISLFNNNIFKMKNTVYLIVSVLFIAACSNHKVSTKRVENILHQMSLKEKIEFIGGYNEFSIRPYKKYGIPEIKMVDGPTGVGGKNTSTSFAASILLASSWDTLMARKVGQAIGVEAKANNIGVVFGPAMNIYRAAFCGRNFEYLGEDPFLAGEIASSHIIGLQSEGVVATAKHYAANNMEYNKVWVSSNMDERTLHEIYLPAFKASVEKGHVGMIMTSYNMVNGVHCSQNDYLNNQVLKKDWGFDGVVISDWGSTLNGVAAANGGLDLEMPSGDFMTADTLLPAIAAGHLSEDVINDKVRRILMLYERFHFFDHPDISKGFTLNMDNDRKLALDEARGGIVLLRNNHNLLPLNGDKPLKIAIIGPNAEPAVTGGGGSAYVIPTDPVSLLKAFQTCAGKNVEINYARGIPDEKSLPNDYFVKQSFYTYVDGKKVSGVLAEFYNNANFKGEPIGKKILDKIDLTFKENIIKELPKNNFAIRFTYFIKTSDKAIYKFAVAGDESYTLSVNGKGLLNKWGNLPKTINTKSLLLDENSENKVVLDYYQKEAGTAIRCGYNNKVDELNKSTTIRKKAIDLAAKSDVVILSVGFNKETEGEGMDRTYEMPDDQDKLIEDIAAINKNCIVVVNAGGNVQMNWIDKVAGLIYAWYPGEVGNMAVAEIVFGSVNPSGKLPVSFEKRWEDSPVFNSYYNKKGDKFVKYSEGVFLGYRQFDQSQVKPLFPFGFGLSYTTFDYSNIKVNKEKITKKEGLEVTFTLANTGNYDGAEIAQLYVSQNSSLLPRPVKELKGFAKTYLRKGQEAEVRIKLDTSAFSYYNKEKGGWITEPGRFKILVGGSSQNILLNKEIEVID